MRRSPNSKPCKPQAAKQTNTKPQTPNQGQFFQLLQCILNLKCIDSLAKPTKFKAGGPRWRAAQISVLASGKAEDGREYRYNLVALLRKKIKSGQSSVISTIGSKCCWQPW